jgi:hypothetical protein
MTYADVKYDEAMEASVDQAIEQEALDRLAPRIEQLDNHLVELASSGNRGARAILKIKGVVEDERTGKDYGVYFGDGPKEHE